MSSAFLKSRRKFNRTNAVGDEPPDIIDVESDHDCRDDTKFSVNIDHDESLFLTNGSLCGFRLTYDSLSLPKYEAGVTDMYVKIEKKHHNYDEAHGEFRSACWRSRNKKKLYRRENIVSTEDAKFMFYVTSLRLQHTESMNDILYRFLDAVSKHFEISAECKRVSASQVPTTQLDANKFVLMDQYAIMDLLPRPKVYQIPVHACFQITDVISLHTATERSFEFAVICTPCRI